MCIGIGLIQTPITSEASLIIMVNLWLEVGVLVGRIWTKIKTQNNIYVGFLPVSHNTTQITRMIQGET